MIDLPTLEEREELIREYGDQITLNGEPAYISGYKHKYPLVVQKESGFAAHWSWSAIFHVCETKGGAFQS